MKAKVNEKYTSLCQSYKLEPKTQIIKYLSSDLVETNDENHEIINLILPGNITENFNNKLVNDDLHPIMGSLLSLGNNIMKIDFSFNKFSQKSGIYLGKLFEYTDNVVSISLKGNQLDDIACEKFIPSLKGKKKLAELNLNTNAIGNIGIMHVNELLYKNPALTNLNIGHNYYDWDGIIAVASALKTTNKSINTLNIDDPSYKNNDQDFFTHIGKMFLSNKVLEKLSLRYHKLRFEGCKILFHHLKNNMVLSVIDLSFNQICFQGTVYISILLEITQTLKSLILNGNQIHNQGAKALAVGLSKNSSLIHLDVTNNGISNDGLCRLAEGLVENTSIKSLKIFKGNKWGNSAIEIFKDLIKIKEVFYPDFEIYESTPGEYQIAFHENKIENEEIYLIQ